MNLTVRAPATVANLGPGFDCLAVALGLYNRTELVTDVEPTVEVDGEGAGELPADATNLVCRTIAHMARTAGGTLPPFRLACRNDIPLQRGLGSSAAAVVTGLILGDRLLGTNVSEDALLEMAVDLEGHPDNVAACLRGGLALAYRSADGWRAELLAPSPELRPAVLVPDTERLATEDARRALPGTVPLGDAAFNVSRVALAVVALSHRPDLLGVALEDRLHQPYRLPLVPASRALFDELRRAGLPVCVAGSGPSLLVFESEGATVGDLSPGWRILRPGIATAGVSLQER